MPHNVLIVVGSLRKQALSLKVAKAIAKLAPASLKCEVVTLESISMYNQDLEANMPADWLAWHDKLRASQGVIFVTPEYNRSTSSVLKNAIDIASRPSGQSKLQGKAIGIIGTAPGLLGGVNAVKHLQQILPGISGPILPQPEMYLSQLGDAFDHEGELVKVPLKELLEKYLAAYDKFIAHNVK
jgi:chromate reductase